MSSPTNNEEAALTILRMKATRSPMSPGNVEPHDGAKPANRPSSQDTRLRIDAYELSCTPEQLAGLGLDHRTAQADQTLEWSDRLKTLASTTLLFTIDQRFDLSKECQIRNEGQIPMIVSVTKVLNGQLMPAATSERVGYSVKTMGRWREDEPTKADIYLEVNCRTPPEAHMQLSENVPLSRIGYAFFREHLEFVHGEPAFLIAGNYPTPSDTQPRPSLIVVRVIAERVANGSNKAK